MAAYQVYDIEKLLSDIQNLLSSRLNTKIASINTEKADSITLKTIDSNAYFTDLNGKQINYNPFILYGIDNIVNKTQRGGSVKTVTVSILVVLEDEGEEVSPYNRMLRYVRALEEVVQENFDLIENSVNLEVQSLLPLYFQAVNSSEFYRAAGVSITGSIA